MKQIHAKLRLAYRRAQDHGTLDCLDALVELLTRRDVPEILVHGQDRETVTQRKKRAEKHFAGAT